MDQTNHFFNIGYGWLCKHCSAEDAEQQRQPQHESAKRNSTLALASWTDASHRTMTCPRCGIEEVIFRADV
jgi:hypothetical protein